ncbi:hypothetical protein CSV67_02765 [Sporosarcina sp. P2]|uniref:Panacea domain-containing protein n=1 Tax=Sporosarcina sp. P2 TaxID=2048251 RepID=UPI000C17016D|nr:type II toxin-antitoxin system antitoxin SocA domain-containing protein [Sporosarcina sp. P2]PID03581.1 hypothetical protein CSV67_02765 [Sporosarcina sp. P2]
MTMRAFADHVISLANEAVGGITNLELQKVMYFALGNYINENGVDDLVTEIYDEPFEAWPYGPVVRSEYFRNRSFGRYNIRNEAFSNERYEALNDFILEVLEEEVNNLVEKSHLHGTWLHNREAILRHDLVEYRLEDIINDFAN